MILDQFPTLLELTLAEKMTLIDELWVTVMKDPEYKAVQEAEIAELSRRIEEQQKNPQEGSTWEEVKSRILSRKQNAA